MKKSFLKKTIPKKFETENNIDLTVVGLSNLNLEGTSRNSVKTDSQVLKPLKSNNQEREFSKQVSFQDFGQINCDLTTTSKFKDDSLIKKQKIFFRVKQFECAKFWLRK